MSIVVGLDISLRCTGIVVLETDTPRSVLSMRVLSTDSSWTDRQVAEELYLGLKHLGETHKPHAWYVERHQFGGATASRMQWVIGYVEGRLQVPLLPVHNMTAKKLIGAKRGKTQREGKKNVLTAVEAQYGDIHYGNTFEERSAIADAIAVAHAGYHSS
jgi:Holliday junction resolvasome RuvABC endonuclease subunit